MQVDVMHMPGLLEKYAKLWTNRARPLERTRERGRERVSLVQLNSDYLASLNWTNKATGQPTALES